MAFKKSILNKYDSQISANGYWRIIEINRNLLTGDSNVVLAGYINKNAREAGSQPIDVRSFTYNKNNDPFTITELDKVGMNAVKIAYTTIKSESTTDEDGNITFGEFANAEDVL